MSEPFPQLDPDLNQLLLVLGRKGSGKSVFAREMFRGWPQVDKLVIDPTGDADPGADLNPVTYRGEPPTRLPAPARRGEHVVARWIADPMRPTYREDLDKALGAALWPKDRRVLIWVDEAGEVFPAGRTGPNARTLLKQSRHWYTSALLCDPRPINLDPLTLAQADRVVMYDMPHPSDRDRVAAAIAVPPKVLNAELDATRARGAHWYLMYDSRAHELYRCPPLPLAADYTHAQQ